MSWSARKLYLLVLLALHCRNKEEEPILFGFPWRCCRISCLLQSECSSYHSTSSHPSALPPIYKLARHALSIRLLPLSTQIFSGRVLLQSSKYSTGNTTSTDKDLQLPSSTPNEIFCPLLFGKKLFAHGFSTFVFLISDVPGWLPPPQFVKTQRLSASSNHEIITSFLSLGTITQLMTGSYFLITFFHPHTAARHEP